MGSAPSKSRQEALSSLADSSNFDREEVLALYKRFKKARHRGNHSSSSGHGKHKRKTLTREEFRQFLGEQQGSPIAERMFRILDKSQKNEVTFEEIVLALSILSRSSTAKEKASLAFRMYSDEELGVTRQSLRNLIGDLHDYAVVDLSPQQLDQMAERLFGLADRNQTGVIDEDEFKLLIERFPFLMDISLGQSRQAEEKFYKFAFELGYTVLDNKLSEVPESPGATDQKAQVVAPPVRKDKQGPAVHSRENLALRYAFVELHCNQSGDWAKTDNCATRIPDDPRLEALVASANFDLERKFLADTARKRADSSSVEQVVNGTTSDNEQDQEKTEPSNMSADGGDEQETASDGTQDASIWERGDPAGHGASSFEQRAHDSTSDTRPDESERERSPPSEQHVGGRSSPVYDPSSYNEDRQQLPSVEPPVYRP